MKELSEKQTWLEQLTEDKNWLEGQYLNYKELYEKLLVENERLRRKKSFLSIFTGKN